MIHRRVNFPGVSYPASQSPRCMNLKFEELSEIKIFGQWSKQVRNSNDENIGGRIARWTFPLSTVEASDLILLLCSGQMRVCPSHPGCGGANRDHHGGGVSHQLQGDLHLSGDDTSLRDNLGGPLEVPWVNEQQ